MLARLFRPCVHIRNTPRLRRAFYSKPGQFTTLDAQGQVSSHEVDIWVGEPHEAYIIIPTEVGNAIEKAILPDVLSNDRYPMVWNHAKKLITCDAAPWVKISAPQDLYKEGSGETSPATLYRFPAAHSIVLDGTFDSLFTEASLQSLRTLKRVLDNLKDM